MTALELLKEVYQRFCDCGRMSYPDSPDFKHSQEYKDLTMLKFEKAIAKLAKQPDLAAENKRQLQIIGEVAIERDRLIQTCKTNEGVIERLKEELEKRKKIDALDLTGQDD